MATYSIDSATRAQAQEARFAYMRRLFHVRDWSKIGIILARVKIDYRSPVWYDYKTGKVSRIPAEAAEKLRAFEDLPA